MVGRGIGDPVGPLASVKMNRQIETEFIRFRTVVFLDAVILSVYLAIFALTNSRWTMLGLFLLFALAIRWGTLWWMMRWAQRATGTPVSDPPMGAISFLRYVVFGNERAAVLFCAGLFGILWCVSYYWPAGGRIIVPCVAAYVAYGSFFPLSLARKKTGEPQDVPDRS
jgi:hypothetical protein